MTCIFNISENKRQLITKCYTGPRNWRAFMKVVMNIRAP